MKHRPAHPRGRQFSLQFSRQLSQGSVRSLPSPKGLGQGRRCRVTSPFQPRPPPGPPADTLQLPDPEYNHDFQGMMGAEDGQDGTDGDNEVTKHDSQTQKSDKNQSPPP